MNRRASTLLLCSILTGAACGGKAVIDADAGAGGQSSTTTSSSAITATSTTGVVGSGGAGGGSNCDILTAAYFDALEVAKQCDNCDPVPESCENFGFDKLVDQCGCPVAVNVTLPTAVSEALDAFDLWLAAGCGPSVCGTPCTVSPNPTCQSNGGCAGTCSN